jgi:hypothetical protein
MEAVAAVTIAILGTGVAYIGVMNFGVLISLVGYLLGIVGSLFWYLFIFVNLMIPQIILVCVLAYKSKPSEESFKKCFDNCINFAKQQSKREDKDTSKDVGIFGRIGLYAAKFVVFKGVQLGTDIFYHDFGVARVAYIVLPKEDDESHMFVGVFGTWIPVY